MAKKMKEMSVEQEATEPPGEDNLDPKIGHNEWVTVRTGPFQLDLYF